MVAEIYGGITALKSIFDMAKGLKDMNDESARKSAVIDLQEKIMNVQETHSSLVRQFEEVVAENQRLKSWEQEKTRYRLETIPPGLQVYSLKPDMANGEPPHRICANCYNKGIKSPLHIKGERHGQTYWICHTCGLNEATGTFSAPRVTPSRSNF